MKRAEGEKEEDVIDHQWADETKANVSSEANFFNSVAPVCRLVYSVTEVQKKTPTKSFKQKVKVKVKSLHWFIIPFRASSNRTLNVWKPDLVCCNHLHHTTTGLGAGLTSVRCLNGNVGLGSASE